jgi:hypothetical protein
VKLNTTKELACRARAGLKVVLLWRRADNRLTVTVADSRTGDSFELPARPENALDVFYHPFAYAAGTPAFAQGAP